MHREDAPDRPTPIDSEPDATQLLRPLTAQERSRQEAETWNWDAVKIYRGGQGPAVSFPAYARGDNAADSTESPDSISVSDGDGAAAAPAARPPTPHAAVWDNVRDRLRLDPAAAALQVWLDDLVLLDLTGTAAIIGTPNVFVRDLVQPHAAALAAGLAQVVGHRADVTAVVDGCR